MESEKTENPKSATKSRTSPIDVYAVQCGKCFKWRIVPTQEEYEKIRSTFVEDPFICNKRSDISCEDPTDMEYDSSRTWAADKPSIPETPVGFKRMLVMRKDFSKFDAYYALPSGKRAKSLSEVEKFLEANPKYKDAGVDISKFSFAVPKIMEDTVPWNEDGKHSASAKKLKLAEEDVA